MKPNLLTPGVWYQIAPGISICLMDTKDFLKLPEWITQRNTVNRLKKRGVLDHLRKLFPTHIIVAVGELTKDDVWEDNTKYSAGHQWRLDANTRARAWQEGKTDKAQQIQQQLDTVGTRKSLTEDLYDIIIENEIRSPDSGAFDWTQVRQFNLMFKTAFGATASEDDAVYLRPETAQGIFVNYKNVLDS